MKTKRKRNKWLALLLTFSLTLGLAWVPALAASETIANESGSTTSGSTTYFGQSFTPTKAITVNSVEFFMQSSSTSSSGTRTVRVAIRTPGGVVLGTSTDTSVRTNGWKTFTFATPVSLNAGTQYYAVIAYSSGSLKYDYATSSSAYPNGSRLTSNNGSSWSAASGDLRFRINNTIKQFTVTFDKNGGDTNAVPTSATVDGGSRVAMPQPPTRNGYHFRGWNTAADGSGTEFAGLTPVTANITVYAQWMDESIMSGGEITVDKSATPFDTYAMSDPFDITSKLPQHRKTAVTLDVDPVPLHKPIDLVLVLDVSNSMDDTDTKLQDMQSAAITLANTIIDNHPLSRVAVVKYGTDAYAYNFGSAQEWRFVSNITGGGGRTYFTQSKANVADVINGFVITGGNDGGTNTEGGFLAADKVMELEGRTDAEFLAEANTTGQRVIVFMTDGVPTYRYTDSMSATSDGSGSQTSVAELNEAIAAGVAAMTHSKAGTNGSVKIFTVGLLEGLTTFQTKIARALLDEQMDVTNINWSGSGTLTGTVKPSLDYEFKYYETTQSSALNEIYYTISGMIDKVATNGVVTDIVSAEWTLDVSSIRINGAVPAAGQITTTNHPDGTTTIVWNIGDLYPAGHKLTYTLTGKTPYYGVADTNDAATLTFNHVMPTPPAGTSSPMTFPIPEAQLNAFAADDNYSVPWNGSVVFDVRDNDPAVNVLVDEGAAFVIPAVSGMTPVYGSLTYSRPGVSGTLSYDAGTGKFTFTPDDPLIDSDYTVTFPYYLTQTTGSGDTTLVMKSEPALVTITVRSPSWLIVSKTNAGGNPAHVFDFLVKIDGSPYNGSATITTASPAGSTTVQITNGVLQLKGGQTARIDGVAIGSSYTVTETARSGYTVTPASGSASGTLPGGGASVAFTNTYHATGSLTLSGKKTLSGRTLQAGEFTFELYAGSTATGTPLRTATHNSGGQFSFTPLQYTLADIGAHTYTVVEKTGSLSGVTYATNTYTVTVNVTDNGDGTLSATPSSNYNALNFTNTYAASGSVTLSGKKTLTGRALQASEFTFELYAGSTATGTPLRTATHNGSGQFSFAALNYTLADVGTKTYTVVEKAGTLAGVTYAANTYTVTVSIADKGDGTLTVVPSANYDKLNFTNTYGATGSVTLSGLKTLNGRALQAGEFTFALYAGSTATGTPIDTASNSSGGTYAFGALNYTLADVGTHTYTVKEVIGTLGGVAYATHTYTVTVTVSDKGDGTLNVVPSTNYNALNFTNTYTASGSVTLSGKKTLNGRDLAAGEFTFGLYKGDTQLDSAVNAANGSFAFGALNYTLADVGTHTYTVREIVGSLGGIVYATNTYTVTVTVTDNGDGTLSVVPSANYNALNFTNTYAATGSVTLSGTKTLNGRPLAANEFTFELYAGVTATGTPIRTAGHASDGTFAFSKLDYTLADVGTHTYTVKEVVGSLGGVTYATNTYTVTVTVSDNGNGTLSVVPSANYNALNFTNTYGAVGSVTFSGTKTLNGRALAAGEFTFGLYKGDTQLDSAVNAANGSFAFGAIAYGLADVGTHTYTVREIVGSLGGVTYATNTYTVTATVSDNGDGTLNVAASANHDALNFTNTYTATGSVTLSGLKTLNGRDLAADEFTFGLFDGDTQIDSAVNAADGSFAFGAIAYGLADVGTHTYTVREIVGSLSGITYATNTYTVTVTVSDKGDGTLNVVPSANYNALNFTNTYGADGSITLSGKKTLNGRALAANEFTFELYVGNTATGTPIRTAGHASDGTFAFAKLDYTLADVGIHTYTVVEKAGSLGGVTYATNTYTVTVTISDNGNGTLNVVPSANYNALNFTNTYAATGSVTLSGLKTLNGRALAAGEFTFGLFDGDTQIDSAVNAADGSFAFDAIAYTLADVGSHTYTVREIVGSLGGVTYATNTYTVTVTVSDNGNGTLNVAASANHNALNFTNSYGAAGSAVLSGTKTLNGRTLAAGEFTFGLYDGDSLLSSATNAADGSFAFAPIDYDLGDVGTHTYTVREIPGSLGGVTYATNVYTVTVTVSDNGDGSLDATATENFNALDFTNTYGAAGSVTLSGLKTLNGRALAANEFTFELYAGSTATGTPIRTAGHASDGTFAFAKLDYTLADVGTHTYTVVEKAGSLGGVTYSTIAYTVTVTVSDNGNGTLNVVPSGNYAKLNFTNTYAATGSVTLSGTKTLNGRALAAGEFTFTLYDGDSLLGSATNAADGSFAFGALNYTLADVGSHTYTVAEVVGSLGGVTYATGTHTVTVSVSDNGNGTLNVAASENHNALDFTNTYAATGSVTLSGAKILNGRDLAAGEFTFTLYDGDSMLGSATNAADGSFTFGALTYTLADVGTHTYTVAEVVGSLGGVTYATGTHTVTVTVSDNGDGTLNVAASENYNALDFTNTYAATGSLDLSGLKTLEGRALAAGEFTFELRDGDAVLDSVQNLADGSFAFATLNYDLDDIGTHTYTVAEVDDGLGGVDYATDAYTVIVNVSDNGDGTLDVTLVEGSANPDGLDFVNVYTATGSATLAVRKALAGRDLTAGEFTFELWSIGGEIPLQTAVNDADGNVLFAAIAYTEADVGSHYYKVVEQAGSESGMLYDPLTVLIVVTVTDDGDGNLSAVIDYTEDVEFDNLYQAPSLALVKVAQNLTTGGPAIDGAIVATVEGEVVRYTVTVTNTGNMTLYDAILTDDLAAAGSAVSIDGVETVWLAGTPDAYVSLGTLLPGQTVTLVYDYTVTTADAVAGIRVNTAAVTADAMMAEYVTPEEGAPYLDVSMDTLYAEDDAIVTAEELPLAGTPSIALKKEVRNRTQGGSFGAAAGGNPGDVFEYRIVVTNDGDLWLADVLVYDDSVAVGSAVSVNGTAAVWGLGADGKGVINVGGLAPGAKVTLTYTYTSTEADVEVARVNTAEAEALVPDLVGSEQPDKVSSGPDSAMLLVDKIPESGEHGSWARILGGAALLMTGAAGIAIVSRRKKEEEEGNEA